MSGVACRDDECGVGQINAWRKTFENVVSDGGGA